MSLEIFYVSATNPNDSNGGGGCVCLPDRKATDCQPPYVVFPKADTSEPGSPHVVVCAACMDAGNGALAVGAAMELGQQNLFTDPEPQATLDYYDDLTEEERVSLSGFESGLVVTVRDGDVVQIPLFDEPIPDPQEPNSEVPAELTEADLWDKDPFEK